MCVCVCLCMFASVCKHMFVSVCVSTKGAVCVSVLLSGSVQKLVHESDVLLLSVWECDAIFPLPCVFSCACMDSGSVAENVFLGCGG